ncbi:MAG: hypothetical protein K2J11_08890 [Oscillospiraceae bacterium]|nr:hypothetical protein [Oscillospiraceae bacterium]
MKKKLFMVFLMCAVSAMLFSGCDYSLKDEDWVDDIFSYVYMTALNDSGMKNIDSAHKDAFESAFNDIEMLGARLCVPMKVSELPDKFELSGSDSEYAPLSENKSEKNRGAGLERHYMSLYYDREIKVARVSIVCEAGQSIEEGIIFEFIFDLLHFQPVLLGGQVDIRFDIGEIKNFLGEGNEFNDMGICTLRYTDGNRMIELSYGIKGDDVNFLTGSIRTYNEL